ncbi:MAG: cell wall hydrolase/autolysin [Lacrimispora sp.]|jgi:N-acetylmuramoyl-L-alanine amidase|nr:cell wall hydrolase/autolysin [Lacrimispora sp.]
MLGFNQILKRTTGTILLAALFSSSVVFAAKAEEETGPAFAPQINHNTTPEIGPGMTLKSNCVVVLDPGHGKTDGHYSGCHFEYDGVTYYEDIITMKITSYTKEYLEKNSNYTVYLTKDNSEVTVPLDQRAAFAASVRADLFVSLHVDSIAGNGTTRNAFGASSMSPRTGRFNNDIAIQSQDAANTILNQLTGLGLHNRGLILQDSKNGTLYPDGTTADYYAIPRYSQMYGLRGFIIEHGYINCTSDLTGFLSTDDQIKKLGEADAKGIIEYLNKAGKSTFTSATANALAPPTN